MLFEPLELALNTVDRSARDRAAPHDTYVDLDALSPALLRTSGTFAFVGAAPLTRPEHVDRQGKHAEVEEEPRDAVRRHHLADMG